MKNYVKLAWYYLDQFDQSNNQFIRFVRFELYLVAFLVFISIIVGIFAQFIFTIWFLPKDIVLSGIDQFMIQYGSVLQFTNDFGIVFDNIFILYDVIFFLFITFITLKLKRRIRNSMDKKMDELETPTT